MKKMHSRGFTLIELLTVIAVISILAALTLTVGPRMIERAKMTNLDSAFRTVEKALIAYSIDFQTLPPAYGYVGFEQEKDLDGPADPTEEVHYYNLMSYMTRMRYHGVEDMYDLFSMSYDTDNDGLDPLEFSPIGIKKPDGSYEFETGLPRFDGSASALLMNEIDRQLDAEKRPFIYIPVNKAQFSKVQKYWIDNDDEYAQNWDETDPVLSRLTFPPKKYDAFVLISVGPAANTFGLLDPPEPLWDAMTANNGRDYYHLLCLRAYFLATRDWDTNGELDFDFIARTRRGQGGELPPWINLRGGAGPVIFVGQ